MPLTTKQREALVTETESWVGTPYRGWSCVKGVGVDCGQLLYGVYHNCGHVGVLNDLPKDYPLYVGQHQASTEYINIVLTYFREIPEADVLPGDVVVWKLKGSLAYCHAAIVKTWPTYFIHALGSGVRAGDARSRLLFRKSDKMFFTLRNEYCGAE
jgi:cell wall-associated NlpC family hydrolase